MGRVLVLYDSASGNTGKMAECVERGARSVPGIETRLRKVEEATAEDILWCHGMAVGSPTNMGSVSWKMKRFWDECAGPLWGQVDGKICGVFASQGGWGGGAELTCQTLMNILLNFGFLVMGVPDYVGKQFTLHYGAVLAGEPRDEREIAACERLGQRVAHWVAYYVDRRDDLHPVEVRRRETKKSA